MTDQSVHDAVWSWLLTCPHIRDLYFNYPAQRFGGTEVSPLTAHRDRPVKEFTSGVSEREYVFVLSRIAPLSDAPGSDENIIELRRAEQLAGGPEEKDHQRRGVGQDDEPHQFFKGRLIPPERVEMDAHQIDEPEKVGDEKPLAEGDMVVQPTVHHVEASGADDPLGAVEHQPVQGPVGGQF